MTRHESSAQPRSSGPASRPGLRRELRFLETATIGTLSLLVMYVLTNVAAAWHLGERSWWQVVAPAAGVLIAGFVLYHNVWPVPPAPYEYFPYLVVGWLVAGLIVTAVIPGFAIKVDDGLERAAELK